MYVHNSYNGHDQTSFSNLILKLDSQTWLSNLILKLIWVQDRIYKHLHYTVQTEVRLLIHK